MAKPLLATANRRRSLEDRGAFEGNRNSASVLFGSRAPNLTSRQESSVMCPAFTACDRSCSCSHLRFPRRAVCDLGMYVVDWAMKHRSGRFGRVASVGSNACPHLAGGNKTLTLFGDRLMRDMQCLRFSWPLAVSRWPIRFCGRRQCPCGLQRLQQQEKVNHEQTM